MFSSHFPTKPQFPELVFTLNLWGVPKQQPRPSVLIFPYHYQRDILFSWETDINQGKKVNTTNFWKGSERVVPRPMSSLRTYSLQTFTGNWVSVRPSLGYGFQTLCRDVSVCDFYRRSRTHLLGTTKFNLPRQRYTYQRRRRKMKLFQYLRLVEGSFTNDF